MKRLDLKQEQKFIDRLIHYENYYKVKYIEELGYCGLQRFIFTVGLCYGVDETGIEGRYCYSNFMDAVIAFDNWNEENPIPQDKDWIKHKGKSGEWSNPNKEK